jgi:exodeoxyribonuclease III
MKILSWNVAGIRARIKKNYLDFLISSDIDIICFQETKATPEQVVIPPLLDKEFPYKYWNSNMGTTQKLGFSGTAIWSKIEALQQLPTPSFDTEGRITTIEFEKYYLLTVYTPNSQNITSERFNYRTEIWDIKFIEYIKTLVIFKNLIICGDLNVCHKEIDIYNPIKYKNKIAGFFDAERKGFSKIIENNFNDCLRMFRTNNNLYTYWNQRFPSMRINNKGYRLDYFLVNNNFAKNITDSNIHPEILGSDHCPISIILNV